MWGGYIYIYIYMNESTSYMLIIDAHVIYMLITQSINDFEWMFFLHIHISRYIYVYNIYGGIDV